MILLDTHVLVWWVSIPSKLSKRARNLIEKEKEILVSSISIWEIAMLVRKERLRLTMDVAQWIEKMEKIPSLQFVSIDNSIAWKSVDLPGTPHDDPADRMIIATARGYGATLITADKRILKYPHVQAVW